MSLLVYLHLAMLYLSHWSHERNIYLAYICNVHYWRLWLLRTSQTSHRFDVLCWVPVHTVATQTTVAWSARSLCCNTDDSSLECQVTLLQHRWQKVGVPGHSAATLMPDRSARHHWCQQLGVLGHSAVLLMSAAKSAGPLCCTTDVSS